MAAGSIAHTLLVDNGNKINVTTAPCVVCGKMTTFEELDRVAFDEWQEGKYIQTAFPDLSPEDREVLISGTHDTCWDILWSDDDND